jgi:glycosyltransferase involved in cell wall biosynthesis
MRPIIVPTPAEPVAPGAAPTFSVIIAAYQAAGTIAEAIESALEQTAAPHEVVVCDDGSTDDLEGAVAPYRDRIVLLRQANGGEGSAKNAAARAATGDFVAILDADDAYLPERLEALAELASVRPDLDILATDAFFEVDGQVAGRFNSERHPFAVLNQRSAILERNFILGNAAVRRERLLGIGGFDESLEIAEDWDCWIRLILDDAVAGSVDQPLARYRIRPQSLSAHRSAAFRFRVRVLEKAAKRDDLAAAERRTLERSLRRHRQRAVLAEAEAALAERRPDSRRSALAVTFGRGFGLRTRLKAALAALAPRLGAWLLERRGRDSGRLRRTVPEPPP